MGDLNGILNVDKPAGISSARVVGQVKRLLPKGTKIGHAGTLDPFATGVLLLLVGKATKACERLMDAPKGYHATIKFGATTETDDPESPERPGPGARASTATASPPRCRRSPAASASGRRRSARRRSAGGGRTTWPARGTRSSSSRAVMIYGVELLEYAWPLATVRVDCGRGTYIRAIARDLGETLGVGGHLTQLRRTRVGAVRRGRGGRRRPSPGGRRGPPTSTPCPRRLPKRDTGTTNR